MDTRDIHTLNYVNSIAYYYHITAWYEHTFIHLTVALYAPHLYIKCQQLHAGSLSGSHLEHTQHNIPGQTLPRHSPHIWCCTALRTIERLPILRVFFILEASEELEVLCPRQTISMAHWTLIYYEPQRGTPPYPRHPSINAFNTTPRPTEHSTTYVILRCYECVCCDTTGPTETEHCSHNEC